MSHRPGRTLMPSVEITWAPSGIGTWPIRPTASMRSPLRMITLSSTGGPPWPSIRRPPTRAWTGPEAGGAAPRQSRERASVAAQADRFMGLDLRREYRRTIRRGANPLNCLEFLGDAERTDPLGRPHARSRDPGV